MANRAEMGTKQNALIKPEGPKLGKTMRRVALVASITTAAATMETGCTTKQMAGTALGLGAAAAIGEVARIIIDSSDKQETCEPTYKTVYTAKGKPVQVQTGEICETYKGN